MQAPRFLSLFIHWEQMFFSVSTRRLFPSRGRYSNLGVKNVKKKKKRAKETLFHFCTPYPPYKNQIENIILTQGDKNSLWLVFQLLLSFQCEAKKPLPFFSRQICIKFYGDYQYKNASTVDPLPVSVIQGSGSDIFKYPEYRFNVI